MILLPVAVVLSACDGEEPHTPPPLPPITLPWVDTAADDTGEPCVPGAPDAPYDGFDADCDGGDDFDADRDGFLPPAFGGEDCDDTDPSIHPDAEPICGDGLDNDCDGIEECGLHGIQVLEELSVSRFDGTAMSGAGRELILGDANGDGVTDLLLPTDTSPCWLFYGSLLDSRSAAEADGTYPGTLCALGDLDGDGRDDIATGFQSLFSSAELRAWSADTPTPGPADFQLDFGAVDTTAWAVAIGDVSGDGVGDLMFSHGPDPAWYDAPGGTVRVWNGPLQPVFRDEDVDVHLLGGPVPGSLGPVEAASDLSGDGVNDVIVRSSSADGFVVAEGPLVGAVELSDHVLFTNGFWYQKSFATGDVDGDGGIDLILTWTDSVGESWVLPSPITAASSRASAIAIATGAELQTATAAGDIDGDGFVDLVGTSYTTTLPAQFDYQAQIFYAPRGVVEADAYIVHAEEDCGILSAAGPGDVDGDGLADFLVGAPGCEVEGIEGQSGAALLVLGAAGGF